MAQFSETISKIEPTELSRFLPPADFAGRESAVLILFAYGENSVEVVLTERAHGLAHHPGQISFPGGGLDDEDDSVIAGALREAEEEIALESSSVEIIGLLPRLWLPVSDNAVTPVVGWWHTPHAVQACDLTEVEQVRLVSLRDLAEPANRVKVKHPSGFIGPGFQIEDWLIWGFTGGILHALLEQFGFAKVWDETKVVEL